MRQYIAEQVRMKQLMLGHELKFFIRYPIICHNTIHRIQMYPICAIPKLHPGNTGCPRFRPKMGNVHSLRFKRLLHLISVNIIPHHADDTDRDAHPLQVNSPVDTISCSVSFI